jgi:autotransporter-associated beta strand protein
MRYNSCIVRRCSGEEMALLPLRQHKSRRAARLIAVAGGIAVSCFEFSGTSRALAGIRDDVGATALQDVAPTITGAGFVFGHAEADDPAMDQFETNPANVFQPASIFTYYNSSGVSASGYPSAVGTNSPHADFVGAVMYGGTFGVGAPASPGGIAFGINNIANYDANYIVAALSNSFALSAKIVNQSFIYTENDNSHLTVADQENVDAFYDNYVDQFGTIFISAAGDTGVVTSPGTAYNSIGVGMISGGFLTGPTADNGRSKPDIVAHASEDSVATAEVGGVAALIYQAAMNDGGGVGTAAAATDHRTIKALLMNGAVKTFGWSHTSTKPLDPTLGSGVVNAYNSYQQLIAGQYSPTDVDTTGSVGGAHPARSVVNVNCPAGWDFNSLSTTSANDSYRNYVIQPAAGLGITGYDLTATLVWDRPMSDPNSGNVSNAINNLSLYLYDSTTSTTTAIDSSASTVDNVQLLYDLNLTAGHVYDIEVLKKGGTVGDQGVLSDSETYSLAFSFVSDPHQSVWVQPGGGSWSSAVNWANEIVPDGAGTAANLGAAIAGPFNLTLDGNRTLGQLILNSTNSYTISPGGPSTSALVFDWGGNSAIFNDQSGSHTISTAIQLNSNLLISITNSGDTMTLGNTISGAGGLTEIGSGTLVLSASNNYAGTTTITSGTLTIAADGALPTGSMIANNGTLNVNAADSLAKISGGGTLGIGASGTLTLSGGNASSQGALSIAAGGTLILNGTPNTLTINYGNGASPNAAIREYLQNGYNNGHWDAGGVQPNPSLGAIASGTAAGRNAYSIGYADGSDGMAIGLTGGQEEIKLTYAGDANLDGQVNLSDLSILASHFGSTGMQWDQADFTYDGTVNLSDLSILASHFGDGVGNPLQDEQVHSEFTADLALVESSNPDFAAAVNQAVPEPGSLALLGLSALELLRRRRNWKSGSRVEGFKN